MAAAVNIDVSNIPSPTMYTRCIMVQSVFLACTYEYERTLADFFECGTSRFRIS